VRDIGWEEGSDMNTASMLNSTVHLARLLYVVYQRNNRNCAPEMFGRMNKPYYIWGKRTLRRMES